MLHFTWMTPDTILQMPRWIALSVPPGFFRSPQRNPSALPIFQGLDWTNVERVLFKTRSSSLPEHRFDESFVYLEKMRPSFLVQKGMLLVGTDAPSVDDFASTDLPSHRMLLQHGIVILEGARLEHVPPGDYELICLPLKLAGLDGSPVRAILRK